MNNVPHSYLRHRFPPEIISAESPAMPGPDEPSDKSEGAVEHPVFRPGVYEHCESE